MHLMYQKNESPYTFQLLLSQKVGFLYPPTDRQIDKHITFPFLPFWKYVISKICPEKYQTLPELLCERFKFK